MKKTYKLLLLSALLFACDFSSSVVPTASPTLTPTSIPPTPIPVFTATPTPIPTSGQAAIMNGFSQYGQSGFQFASGEVVAWDSNKADILAGGNPISFFFQFDAAPYNDPALDKDAHSGGVKMSQTDLDQIAECPASGYKHHWFPVRENVTYCIQTRDGEHYAKIKVVSISQEQIVFEWAYQPKAIRQFEK